MVERAAAFQGLSVSHVESDALGAEFQPDAGPLLKELVEVRRRGERRRALHRSASPRRQKSSAAAPAGADEHHPFRIDLFAEAFDVVDGGGDVVHLAVQKLYLAARAALPAQLGSYHIIALGRQELAELAVRPADAAEPICDEHHAGGLFLDVGGLPDEQAEAAMGRDFALMFDWFNRVGYSVDIPALEKKWKVPLTRFKAFLQFVSWAKPISK